MFGVWGVKSINNTHNHQESLLSFFDPGRPIAFFGPSNNPKAELSLPLLFFILLQGGSTLPIWK